MDTDELIGTIAVWGQEHGIDNPDKQTVKLLEECGELAHEIVRNRYDSKLTEDAIGDIGVVLIILADILGYDFGDCLRLAYNEIKDRTGHTESGSFIKDGEKSYKIVAYGPGKELLTWSCSGNLDNIKKCLKADGYDEIKVVEEDG